MRWINAWQKYKVRKGFEPGPPGWKANTIISEPKRILTNAWLFPFYLSSQPVAHLSDAPRRRLVVTGDSARIQDETTESSAWFFNVLGV